MKKEEFAKQLLEQQIFDELKDTYFTGIKYIRAKYQGSGIDFDRVYRRIVNYRIKNYGNSYMAVPVEYKTSEERKEDAHRVHKCRRWRIEGK